jgi:uncharacterized membrane protein YhhN
MVFYRDFGSPFLSGSARMYLDIAFWAVATTYMVGDYLSDPKPFTFFTALTFLKAIPIFLIAYQVWSVREAHSSVRMIFIGLLLGALGDILLLISGFVTKEGDSLSWFFIVGALSFLIGHVFYTISFLESATDGANGQVNLAATMAHKVLYMLIWTVLVGFTFYIMSDIVSQQEEGSPVVYIMATYGTFLLMMVMASFFFYFTCKDIDELVGLAGLLAAIGAVSFYFSDLLLAENNFNSELKDREKVISLFNMITYYLGQFLIGKSAVKTAAYFLRSTKGTPV